MSSLWRWLLMVVPLALLAPLLTVEPEAEMPPPLGYVCFKSAGPIVIDGKLDDASWKAAPWTSDFVDIEGDRRPRPRFRTRAKMLWDDQALYIAAELSEPHVWGTLTQHDAVIFHDPDFEVFLDLDGDNYLYGELELNALNTTWDLLLPKPYRDGGPAINGWEIIGLKTAVQVQGTLNDPSDTDTGWTVEIAWPWAGLRELTQAKLPPRDGDRHRINFSRVEWDIDIVKEKYVKIKGRPEYNWVWSPQSAIDMHRPERWGGLQYSTRTQGPVEYRDDPDQAVKDVLHSLYYAQKEYHKQHRRFAGQVSDLNPGKLLIPTPLLESLRGTYILSGSDPRSRSGKTWLLNHEGRLWSE